MGVLGRGGSLLTRDTGLLWVASFGHFLSFFLLLTALPLYALELGGQEADVGLVLGVFALSAMCLRPIAGWLLDKQGRVPVLAAGAAIFALASAGYAAVGSLAALLGLRVVHGVGMGLGATAAPTLAGDLAPSGRRGAAIGLQGSAQNLASAVGPPVGAYVALTLGYPPLFVAAALIAALGAAAALLIREPVRASESPLPLAEGQGMGVPERGRRGHMLSQVFVRRALYPGLIALGLHIAYGAVSSFVPVYATRTGLENPGLYFLVFALAMIVAQTIGGRASDRFGRTAVIVPGLALLAVGVAMLPLLGGWSILVSALVVGFGQGAAQPALFAMAVDRVGPDERGAALGTIGTFLEMGIGGGSILAGLLAGSLGLAATFVIVAVAPLAAMGLALARPPIDAHSVGC